MDYIELSAAEARELASALHTAASGFGIHKMRVSVEGDRVKFKVNEGIWSPPMGRRGEQY